MTRLVNPITDDEYEPLLHALARGEGRGVTAEEIADLVNWCNDQIVSYALVCLLLDGRVIVKRDPDQAHDYRWYAA